MTMKDTKKIYKDPSFNKGKYWTRFDDYDKKLTDLKTQIEEMGCDCQYNYDQSEAHFKNIQQITKNTLMDFDARLQWA